MADPTVPDPLECLNVRMVGGEPTCDPDTGHCVKCQYCNEACKCSDALLLDKALDAFAHHTGATSWSALADVISHHTADTYRDGIAAAIRPLQDEIHRLTAEIENLKHSKETP